MSLPPFESRQRWQYPSSVGISIRLPQLGDNADELRVMGHAGWLSGHGHLFSAEENARVIASTTNDIFRTSWVVPPPATMYIAVDGPRIVGAIELREAVDGYGLIEPINVSPEYQRRGIGDQLWTMAAMWSKWRGDKGLRVWALDGNDKAMNFYKKIGCGVVGTGWLALGTHVEPATAFQYDH
jgi:GNAT superfamily N-acetyltransferase